MGKKRNLCMECPVRGRCCYLSFLIHGYNVIVDFQPCEHLDTETGLCKDYKNRLKVKHCKNGLNKFNQGALHKDCLYLKEHPELEDNPKVNVKDVASEFTAEELMFYNSLVNMENLWEIYLRRMD